MLRTGAGKGKLWQNDKNIISIIELWFWNVYLLQVRSYTLKISEHRRHRRQTRPLHFFCLVSYLPILHTKKKEVRRSLDFEIFRSGTFSMQKSLTETDGSLNITAAHSLSYSEENVLLFAMLRKTFGSYPLLRYATNALQTNLWKKYLFKIMKILIVFFVKRYVTKQNFPHPSNITSHANRWGGSIIFWFQVKKNWNVHFTADR